ncbi:quinol monooxygenase YgiN [Streptomyces griseochromogenes]|uniref:Antibiotic biosynthesis monooxygenase n=1 Tax=Streptomyces griseochromogenes TaxID=68214 RepID=A0A1B1B2S8_9ACTN|nr:antibiotic biosynthesis monooxygenase family protein [Streptomyces griseochromogenes]ANP53051.1 antibiotic biosynthesis monooxygenase [Streptomyces griseochromogenes]MBP2047732.1 quinol monooxygenase YgiN [Streptomyces griseochromogenes]
MTVWEVVQLPVAESHQNEFESVVRSHLPLLKEADGCLDVKLLRAIGKEGALLLWVLWQSLEHHTEVFMKTEAFTEFSSAMMPFFTATPEVLHASTAIDGF